MAVQRLSLFIPQPACTRIPEIVMIAMLNMNVGQGTIETCWTKEYSIIVVCYAHDFKNARPHLFKTQLDIVITRYEGHTASWCINKMAQRFKERAVSGNNLIELFQGSRNINAAFCIVGRGCQKIEAIAIDNKLNIIGLAQWSRAACC